MVLGVVSYFFFILGIIVGIIIGREGELGFFFLFGKDDERGVKVGVDFVFRVYFLLIIIII